MFQKEHIGAVFDELKRVWQGKPEFEQLFREAHLGIALFDAGRSLKEIDPRVVALIEKHKPKE